MLTTHLNGKPLTVEHAVPLRLVVRVKLGLKNVKAITRITYTKDEPADLLGKAPVFALRRNLNHYPVTLAERIMDTSEITHLHS